MYQESDEPLIHVKENLILYLIWLCIYEQT